MGLVLIFRKLGFIFLDKILNILFINVMLFEGKKRNLEFLKGVGGRLVVLFCNLWGSGYVILICLVFEVEKRLFWKSKCGKGWGVGKY